MSKKIIKKFSPVWILVTVTCIFLFFTLFSNAFANENNIDDRITIMGKVVDSEGQGVQSAQIQYSNDIDVPSIYYAALDGGFMISIPCTSDCSLTYYQDGYEPLTISYSLAFLEEHLPVLNVGNICLPRNMEYVSISGTVLDLFYSTPIEDARVSFLFTNVDKPCWGLTDSNGYYTLTVPKGYTGIWQVIKDDYVEYVSGQMSYNQDTTNINFNLHPLNKFKICFETNGADPIDFQVVDKGQTLVRPQDPILENYVFDDWFLDNKTFNTKYDFSQTVDSDFSLYAKWNVDKKVDENVICQTSDNLVPLESYLLFVLLFLVPCSVLFLKFQKR